MWAATFIAFRVFETLKIVAETFCDFIAFIKTFIEIVYECVIVARPPPVVIS